MKFEIPNWAIVLIIIAIVLTPIGAAIKTGLIDTAKLFGLETGEVKEEEELPAEQIYYGAAQFKVVQGNYFTGAAVTPTNPIYTMFHSKPTKGVAGTAITASGTTTEINKEDNGYVYMEIYGGDDYYIKEDAFLLESTNPRIKDSYWEDFDADGKDDFIIKLWVGDVGERGQGLTPVVSLSLPLVSEDDGNIADDNPADITGIGTSEVVKSCTWKLSGIPEQKGYAIARLYIGTNTTRGGDDIRFENLKMYGGWTVEGQSSWSMPIREENGNYEAWYIATSDYTEVHLATKILREKNVADALFVELSARCTFETGDHITVTLYVDFITAEGNIDSISDAVEFVK